MIAFIIALIFFGLLAVVPFAEVELNKIENN